MSGLAATFTQEEYPDDESVEDAGWLGGVHPPPSRAEYLERLAEGKREVFLAIESEVKRKGLVGMTGEQLDTGLDIGGPGHFVLSDGRVASFSWRGWGDVMQAIVDKREGYMRYYM